MTFSNASNDIAHLPLPICGFVLAQVDDLQHLALLELWLAALDASHYRVVLI